MVLWIGASGAEGDLTLGQLIGYVTQPLLRLSTIWRTSRNSGRFERLADVIVAGIDEVDKSKVCFLRCRGRCGLTICRSFRPGQPQVKDVS